MTTDYFPHAMKKYTAVIFKLPVIVALFALLVIGNTYVTIMNSSYADEMANPLALIKMPVVYVDMIDDSIDSRMTASLPPEAENTGIPVPQSKPVRQLSALQ